MIIIILAVCTAVLAFLYTGMRKSYTGKSNDYESLLKAIQSPICIVDVKGRLISIINRRYVKESTFDMDAAEDYDMTAMIDDIDDRERFMNNLKSVINSKDTNYVNQDFIVRDHYGTAYRALLHIIFYKPGQAYVFINRVRLPKENQA